MKVTTDRDFRKKYLKTYTVDDFDCFDDYFFYLHLNHRTQLLHALGFFLSVPFIPWGIKQLLKKNVWPLLLVSSVFYGSGYISHWTEDGQISKTAKQFLPSYKGGILLAWRFFIGSMVYHEARFMKKYPHVMWVYFK